jgi:hypothetical protein
MWVMIGLISTFRNGHTITTIKNILRYCFNDLPPVIEQMEKHQFSSGVKITTSNDSASVGAGC